MTSPPLSELDQMIIEHVTPIIASLPRDQPYLAKDFFADEVWVRGATLFGQRIAHLVANHKLPLTYHETTRSNSRTYWIRFD